MTRVAGWNFTLRSGVQYCIFIGNDNNTLVEPTRLMLIAFINTSIESSLAVATVLGIGVRRGGVGWEQKQAVAGVLVTFA